MTVLQLENQDGMRLQNVKYILRSLFDNQEGDFKMIKIKKIEDKEEIEVLSQYHCRVQGKPAIYQGDNDDCLNDCKLVMKPKYYVSSKC